MNERIQELVEQSTDKWVGGEFFDREKFAHLIVKECIDIVERHGSMIGVDYIKENFEIK